MSDQEKPAAFQDSSDRSLDPAASLRDPDAGLSDEERAIIVRKPRWGDFVQAAHADSTAFLVGSQAGPTSRLDFDPMGLCPANIGK